MAEDKFDPKKEYQKFKKKYSNLPDYDTINGDFEFYTIDKEDFFLRRIRRRMNEKLIFYCRVIENIIYPSVQSAVSAYEASFFNDEEKKNLVNLHKNLMVFERRFLSLDAKSSEEKEDVEVIVDLAKLWPGFNKEVNEFANKMCECWKKDIEEEGEKYFG